MTSTVEQNADLANRTLADIATHLPGATAVFRKAKLDFCCGGNIALQAAAAEKDLPLGELVASLSALNAEATESAPRDPSQLVPYIVTRFHEVHRREIPELIRIAKKVEAVHREHPLVPRGLAEALEDVGTELGSHMEKEETVLFPMMLAGGNAMIRFPITQMRLEHTEHGERLRHMEKIAYGFEPPPEACATWRALYTGLRKLVDDLMEHIHLENNVLFPQFADNDGRSE
jgi:regulator of cell morphogenesis and NO signaling